MKPQNRFAYAATERESHQDLFDMGTGEKVRDFDTDTSDICANRHKGNTESRAAFKRVKDRLTEAQARVFVCILSSGVRGRTNDEICVVLGLTPNQVSPRLVELKIQGKIVKKGTRLTRSGCPASVNVAT